MKPQAPCYSEIFPELKAADFRWPEWLPWLAGCLWFCPMYSRRPLAAVLCKSLHPSVSSEGNAFHYCSFLAQVPQDLPVHWHQISASSVLWNDNLAFCLKSPCSEDRGGTVQAQRRTLLSSCTITAIDSPQLSLEPGSTDSSLACWCSCLHRRFILLNLSLFPFHGLLSQQEQANKKRERVISEKGTELPKQEKKRPKASQQPEELEAPKQFTPFDYSKSNFKVFAGKIWISC